MLQNSAYSGDAPDIDSLRLPPKRGGPMFSEYFGSVPMSVSLRNQVHIRREVGKFSKISVFLSL